MVAAEEAVQIAVKNRDESFEALVRGEKRLEELWMQLRSPFAGPVADAETELVRLRGQVAALQGSTRVERPRVNVSPSEMLCLIPAKLSAWMANRQKDMQEAFNTGDNSRIIELSSKPSVWSK